MKVIGTKREIETFLSAIPGAPDDTSPIPPDGWVASYRGIPIDIELTEEQTKDFVWRNYMKELLLFKMRMLQAGIAMNGMIAENKQRETLGQSMAYTEQDFLNLIKDYEISENDFPI